MTKKLLVIIGLAAVASSVLFSGCRDNKTADIPNASLRKSLMELGWYHGFNAGMAWQRKFDIGGFDNTADGLAAVESAKAEFMAKECR